MSKIKVSNLEDTINETEVSAITKPKRVRPPRIPVKDVESPTIEPPPEPVHLSKPRLTKQPRMITCVNCGKELLEKTLRYYHQVKCKPSVPLRDTVQPETKTNEITNTTVDFDYRRSTPQRPVKYASILSRAF